ncbi:hypothetical protein J6590_029901 [Homalodisca vitripennis]|nr:hypothetical protein J6590_029901 [Homalodisca vitripennis]
MIARKGGKDCEEAGPRRGAVKVILSPVSRRYQPSFLLCNKHTAAAYTAGNTVVITPCVEAEGEEPVPG